MEYAAMTLPAVYRPEEVAQHLGWSERRVRSEAKRLGACLLLGNRMALTQADVLTLMEAQRCPSSSTGAKIATSGISKALLGQMAKGSVCAAPAGRPTKALRRDRLPRSSNDTGKV